MIFHISLLEKGFTHISLLEKGFTQKSLLEKGFTQKSLLEKGFIIYYLYLYNIRYYIFKKILATSMFKYLLNGLER
jgi:hypothetical protein